MNGKIAAFQAALFLFAPTHIAEAQQGSPHRIGFVSPASASSLASRLEAFKQALRDLGYVEGQNINIEYRWAEGREERLPDLAAELVRLKVGIVVTHGVVATHAARSASATIPIVCFACGDLTATGLVESLARPGRNVTGVTLINPEMSGKRLELLKELFPKLSRVAVFYNSGNPVAEFELKTTQTAAQILGLSLQIIGVKDPAEFELAVGVMGRERAEALIVLSDAMFLGQGKQIADLATGNRLPTIFWTGELAKVGGLIGFGPDGLAISRRAAGYLDKILKGAKPGELPVEQPTKFELIINLKTARALGLTIPPSLLARADEVIE